MDKRSHIILSLLLALSVTSSLAEDSELFVPVKNFMDLRYVARMGVGSLANKPQCLDFGFDSQSVDNWATPKDCEGCKSLKEFDPSAGTKEDAQKRVIRSSAGSEIEGYQLKAKVRNCSTSQRYGSEDFIVAQKMTHSRKIDAVGAFGLSARSAVPPPIIVDLKNKKLIKKEIVTIHYESLLASEREQSWLRFGVASTEGLANGETYQYHELKGQSPVIATLKTNSGKDIEIDGVFFDTLNAFISVSQDTHEKLMAEINGDSDDKSIDIHECDVMKLPTFTLTIGSQEFELSPIHYLSYSTSLKGCYLNFSIHEDTVANNSVYLGAPFLRLVNLVLDYTEGSVGLAKSSALPANFTEIYASKKFPVDNSLDDDDKPKSSGAWGWAFLIFLCGGIALGAFLYRRKKELEARGTSDRQAFRFEQH